VNQPIIVDARGHRCPTPSLKLQKAMADAAPGVRFVLLATDPMARIDVPFMMSQKNGRLVEIQQIDGVLHLTVESGPVTPDALTD